MSGIGGKPSTHRRDERREALKMLENRALDAKSLDDLVGVVVDLIRGIKGGKFDEPNHT